MHLCWSQFTLIVTVVTAKDVDLHQLLTLLAIAYEAIHAEMVG
jgi:hypothetical protein